MTCPTCGQKCATRLDPLGTWYELAAVARENDDLADFIEAEAAKEITEYFYQPGGYTKDWSDVVTSADKFRRMRRAQIAAWRKWQADQ